MTEPYVAYRWELTDEEYSTDEEYMEHYQTARDDVAIVGGGLSGAGAGALLGMLGGPVGMFLGATIGASTGGGIGFAAGAPEWRSRVLTRRVQKTRAREVRREETRYRTMSVTETEDAVPLESWGLLYSSVPADPRRRPPAICLLSVRASVNVEPPIATACS